MVPIRDQTARDILKYVQENGSTPNNLPGVEAEDLHNHLTYLFREGFITGKPYHLGDMDKIVFSVLDPELTDKALEFLNNPEISLLSLS